MRKLFTIIVYTFVILLIGRNMASLPKFNLLSSEASAASNLKKEIQQLVSKQKGTYGVYFYNFTDKSSFGLNEESTFTAASVNKVPIVAVLYSLNSQGKVDLDEQITIQQDDLQDYGTGSIRYKGAGQVYTLRSLARLSLQQSDNTAAHVIAKKIGVDVIQNTITNWGLTQTSIEENKTSPKDMSILFQKLYNEQITSSNLTKEFFSFMKDTDIEDRLSKELPSDAVIYHKTGDAVGNLHDVGIIKRGDLTFFIGVLTSDIGEDETKAKIVEADIARNILLFYAKHE